MPLFSGSAFPILFYQGRQLNCWPNNFFIGLKEVIQVYKKGTRRFLFLYEPHEPPQWLHKLLASHCAPDAPPP